MIVFPRSVYEPSSLVSRLRFCSAMKNPGEMAFTRNVSPYLDTSNKESKRTEPK